ncbi:hypothetical protein DOE76_15085 [Leifsonia sp. ku-ls]|nr:hypothetical protein DOE76_15085 [Leifsonia sp. ku-ls]
MDREAHDLPSIDFPVPFTPMMQVDWERIFPAAYASQLSNENGPRESRSSPMYGPVNGSPVAARVRYAPPTWSELPLCAGGFARRGPRRL